MRLEIYPVGVWIKKKIIFNGKDYIIDDGSDYFLSQIHKILKGEQNVNN